MNSDSENFNELRRMLALKRHEQPPPGYFDRLSIEVVARINAGERGQPDSLAEWIFRGAPWLEGILKAFETRPMFAGAFGAAVCALLISGVLYSEETDTQPVSLGTISAPRPALVATPAMIGNSAQPMMADFRSSTNPLAAPSQSLFDQFQIRLQPENASISVSGGN